MSFSTICAQLDELLHSSRHHVSRAGSVYVLQRCSYAIDLATRKLIW
jgi:hypothetical protein